MPAPYIILGILLGMGVYFLILMGEYFVEHKISPWLGRLMRWIGMFIILAACSEATKNWWFS
jgi:hypothetical protein